MTDEDRFWSKVQIGEPDDCWWWLAYRDNDGYGKFGFRGKVWGAHRVAWVMTYGEIPKGLYVCHKCDEPSCCNPYHLFITDHAGNMEDMAAKGRKRGERHGRSKLTESEVWEIRRLLKETDLTQGEIGKMFGMCQGTIGHIATGHTWDWLTE